MLLRVRSREFAEEFAASATKILSKTRPYKVRVIQKEDGYWYFVKVTSFLLYDFVNQPVERLWAVIDPFPKGFLRGFFTAEGNPSVSVSQIGRIYLDVGLGVSNTDYLLLEFSRNLLLALGFRPGRIKLDREEGEKSNLAVVKKPLWRYNMSRFADAQKFCQRIGFADSDKQSKLMDAISIIKECGRIKGAFEWMHQYEKRRGYWDRKGPDDFSAA